MYTFNVLKIRGAEKLKISCRRKGKTQTWLCQHVRLGVFLPAVSRGQRLASCSSKNAEHTAELFHVGFELFAVRKTSPLIAYFTILMFYFIN